MVGSIGGLAPEPHPKTTAQNPSQIAKKVGPDEKRRGRAYRDQPAEAMIGGACLVQPRSPAAPLCLHPWAPPVVCVCSVIFGEEPKKKKREPKNYRHSMTELQETHSTLWAKTKKRDDDGKRDRAADIDTRRLCPPALRGPSSTSGSSSGSGGDDGGDKGGPGPSRRGKTHLRSRFSVRPRQGQSRIKLRQAFLNPSWAWFGVVGCPVGVVGLI